MKISFHLGFITYDFGDNDKFLFVDLHPTTDLTFIPRDDIGADFISVNLARRLKCKAIVTALPRNQQYGMDLNRLPPKEADAIRMFSKFVNENHGDTNGYEKKYAWAATDKPDHAARSRIYRSFWSAVRKAAGTLSKKGIVVFVHVQNPELRNYPSAIDVIPIYNISGKRAKSAIEKVNKKYGNKFRGLKDDYTSYALSYNRNQYKSILTQMFGSLDPRRFSGSEKENYKKMLRSVSSLGFRNHYRELKDSYSIESHAKAIKKICGSVPLRVTYMANFTGKLAFGTKKETKGCRVLEVEVNAFLSEVRTDIASDVLEDIVKTVSK
jgi:hypothetical protein